MLQSNHTVNAAGHLAVGGVDTVELAAKYGTPLYVLDEALIRARMREYVTAMKNDFPAGSRVFLASKALSCKEIYRIARSEGMGTDVVSSGELYTALAAGMEPENMCFHGSAKTMEDVRYGVTAGVGCFVVDNREELERLSHTAARAGMRQKILLRLSPGIDPHTFAAVNTGKVDSKFGAAIETGQAMELVRLALQTPAVELLGFHCHIGSQIAEAEPFMDAMDIMVGFMVQVRSELGVTLPVLNLGGGLAVPYVEGDPTVDIPAVLAAMGGHLRELCETVAYPAPAVWMEPGRSVVAAAGVTLYTVQSIKSIPEYKNYIAVDGGMTDNPRYALYSSKYTVLLANRAGEPTDYTADLAGRCCESGDLIGEGMAFPTPAVGDTVAVLVTGAYNYSMASNYNRVPRPAMVMVREGRDRLVVRRETFEDIVACDL